MFQRNYFQFKFYYYSARIITVGPGIDDPDLPFPSRYFFILHQNARLKSIEIHPKRLSTGKDENISKHTRSCCHLMPKILNETQFCLRIERFYLLSKWKENTNQYSFDELIDHSKFCDDELLDHEQNSNDNQETIIYWLTIYRYILITCQCKCNQLFELIINEQNSTFPVYKRDLITMGSYSDGLNCPRNDWPIRMNCQSKNNNELHRQIDNDLKIFNVNKIDFLSVLDEVKERFAKHPHSYAICHYKILANQVNYFNLN